MTAPAEVNALEAMKHFQVLSSGQPILLRTSANAGHGSGNSLSEQIEQSVDMYAFLFDQLQVED